MIVCFFLSHSCFYLHEYFYVSMQEQNQCVCGKYVCVHVCVNRWVSSSVCTLRGLYDFSSFLSGGCFACIAPCWDLRGESFAAEMKMSNTFFLFFGDHVSRCHSFKLLCFSVLRLASLLSSYLAHSFHSFCSEVNFLVRSVYEPQKVVYPQIKSKKKTF